ncbi:MAG: hypothetical protein CMI52_01910 [Parcubacteria group bacterium]|nr:hypothetical protein [Parcubacteria group bacterium]
MTPLKLRQQLERAIRATEKALEKIRKEEAKSRAKWTKRYQRFTGAAAKLAGLKNTATQRAQRLKDIITSWPTETVELTKDRDAARVKIAEKETKLQEQRTELAVLLERLENVDRRTDGIVDQVFALNDQVVSAFGARNDYLNANVYDMLTNEDGSLRSQITLTSTDGLRRVVALVNHITRIDTTLAHEAKEQIDVFFARFTTTQTEDQDETTSALISILENILVERLTFKVGPDLYRFISIDIDADVFPELKRAQHLLRNSLRSEKTSSYIRLYRRASEKDKWKEVKLS